MAKKNIAFEEKENFFFAEMESWRLKSPSYLWAEIQCAWRLLPARVELKAMRER